jgi:acetylornithine deacetylase/succinyl-diaminopimelate desuccinylase-like protein
MRMTASVLHPLRGRNLAFAAVSCVAIAAPLRAQSDSDARSVRAGTAAYRQAHEAAILSELTGFLEMPNLASDRPGIRRNAEALLRMLAARGVAGRLLESEGSPPAVFGELRVPGATKTVVMYAHYDGQPVDTTQWASRPWTPVYRDRPLEEGGRQIDPADASALGPETRIYARSASDDKSPIIAMLTALDALHAAGRRPSVNLKFFFEGEEEAGSPHLGAMLARHADVLRADAWIFCDGPVHQSRRQTVVFGARGVATFQVTVYGPTRALHSGHYGNWAPNPALLLARLIASMRDDDGRITIAGFMDDVRPVTAAESAAAAAIPSADAQLREEVGLAGTEAHDAPVAARILLPALNVQGFLAGHVGAAAVNAIPVSATAAFDFRLVPDQTPERLRALVEAHLRAQGYHVVTAEPDSATRRQFPRIARLDWGGGYAAERTPLDAPVSRAVVAALQPAIAEPLILVPSLGGSLPLHDIEAVVHVPLVTLPVVNHDNNQHASNENVRLQNFRDAIEIFAVLMARLGAEWRERL